MVHVYYHAEKLRPLLFALISAETGVQLNNPAGGAIIPLQSGLSCAASKAIIDCSLLFEQNAQARGARWRH